MLQQLFKEYEQFMYHIANKILNNDEDARDVVGQVFLEFTQNLPDSGEPHSDHARYFVAAVTENLATDIYRKKQRHPLLTFTDYRIQHNLNDWEREFDEAVPCPSGTLEACIAQLKHRERQIIILRYHIGLSAEEAAGVMRISYEAARKLD